ncbi:hypothetical protein BC831DRAFT_141510 [Entophlyctis helioformis]|nr:hypothetical protein BC831DRAFT_141510 [Entophlyctis helioformis]
MRQTTFGPVTAELSLVLGERSSPRRCVGDAPLCSVRVSTLSGSLAKALNGQVHAQTDMNCGHEQTYVPRDLNDRHVQRFMKTLKVKPTEDVLDRLNIDALKDYKACFLIACLIVAWMARLAWQANTQADLASPASNRTRPCCRTLLQPLDTSSRARRRVSHWRTNARSPGPSSGLAQWVRWRVSDRRGSHHPLLC